MILGMTPSTFAFVHVLLSLVGIGLGLVVVFGLLAGKRLDGWTALFLASTVLTSAALSDQVDDAVLAIGGEKSNGDVLGQQVKLVASDAAVVVLKNTGHWVLEENSKGTTDALTKFL